MPDSQPDEHAIFSIAIRIPDQEARGCDVPGRPFEQVPGVFDARRPVPNRAGFEQRRRHFFVEVVVLGRYLFDEVRMEADAFNKPITKAILVFRKKEGQLR